MISSLSVMEKRLFILLIFVGAVELDPSVPRKYYPVLLGIRWPDAQAYCRASYFDLASFENDAQMTRLLADSKLKNFAAYAWIGLYNDVNSWRWSFGNETLGVYRPWYPGLPNNRHGNDECTFIHSSGWHDDQCLNLREFVCLDVTRTGTDRFIYYSIAITWFEAQRFCRQNHTDLASVRDSNEMSIILGKIPYIAWIGLYRDNWKWSDRTNMSSTKWIPSTSSTYDCAYMYAVTGQTFSTICSNYLPFFCYTYVTGQRKVVKIKIQMDQDVDITAVKAAILNQIQQKLNGRRLENVRVRFKMQRNGNVFEEVEGDLLPLTNKTPQD